MRPQRRRPLRIAIVLAVLVAGVLTTREIAGHTQQDLEDDARSAFVDVADTLESRLRTNFVRYEDLVVAGASLLTGPEPSQLEWQLLLDSLRLRQRYPGAVAMAYIRHEPAARRLVLLAPPPPDESLLGLDVSGVRELSALEPVIEGQQGARLTPPVPWFRSRDDLDDVPGEVLVLVAPVAAVGGGVQGWIGLSLAPDRLAHDLLDVEPDVTVALRATTVDGRSKELARTGAFTGDEPLRRVRQLDLYGQTWTLDVRGELPPSSGLQHPPTIVAVAGLLVTALAATGVVLLGALRERRRAHLRDLAHQARHDGLTALPNRELLRDHLAASIEAARAGGTYVAVLFVDLDRFKLLNDSLGHEAGDEVLRVVAERLRATVRSGDVVARIGGDEFIVCSSPVRGPAAAAALAERVREAVAHPLLLAGRELYLTASVGLRLADGASPVDELLRDADAAMYHAKAAGRDRVAAFEETKSAPAEHRLSLAADLRRAAERDELRLHLQPVVRLDDGAVVGWEALVRWQHPRLGLLAPAQFVELAEDTGLIVGVGDWVLRAALAWLAQVPGEEAWVAVNLSPRQLDPGDLVERVDRALADHGIGAGRLVVELTESALPRAGGVGQLDELRARGVRVAVDDFGTGWSSLAALRHLPVDLLKVDRSFVARLGSAADDAVVTAVVQLGRALGLTVLAEGVEEPGQRERLRELGCDLAQGYLLGRPAPPEVACLAGATAGAGAGVYAGGER